ncbi:efflux RND transporter periplasmic adaptor subunit [soil metagenome]
MSEPLHHPLSGQPATETETEAYTAQSRTLRRLGIGAAIVALAVAGLGIASRIRATHGLEQVAAESALPIVTVVTPSRAQSGGDLVLPGAMAAFNSAAIYARTNGYVRRWLADIGDKVVAGQTLAILDAPEVDQQLAQAKADYQTAVANRNLAQSTATRWTSLLAKDAVSRQESDEKAGDLAAKSAAANGELANVKRLSALQGFTRLEAPFAGIVTSRSAQIGALVMSGSAAAQPLFTVSDVRRMRIYVRVPQGFSAQVQPGLHATMTLPEYPGKTFDATLTRSANAVDVSSGTVLVQLEAENPQGALKPGAFVQVSFPIQASTGTVHVPASAVIFGENGPTVAIVDGKGNVTVKSVTVGHDAGKEIEILAGLTGREQIIDTPPDAIGTGDRVRVQRVPAAADHAKN